MEKISKPAFPKQFPDHLSELFCMSCVLQVSMGRDFDEKYGPIRYHISERTELLYTTIPLDENVIIVTINKNISPITNARKIIELTSEYRNNSKT